MGAVFDFISGNMNAVIVLFGIALLVWMLYNFTQLNSHRMQIKMAMDWNSVKSTINRKTREVEETTEEDNVTPDTVRNLETEFNKSCSAHEVITQLIPILPLFGILGTVAGLIGVAGAGGSDAMLAALNTALSSTFWGLVFSIGLKLLDAVGPAKAIFDTEVVLEDYNKKLSNAVMMNNISE